MANHTGMSERYIRLKDEDYLRSYGAYSTSPEQVADHVHQLLVRSTPPKLPADLAAIKGMPEIHLYITTVRNQLQKYVNGDFSDKLKTPGVVAGMLKALQANMLHLIWKMQQVQSGDLSHKVDFMGEFSNAFNSMTQQLDDALTALQEKEAELTTITQELQQEVEKRGAALSVLRKSAENFKYLAEHDPLTGLLNRRSFFARAEVELAKSVIMSQPCVVIIIDIDNFKRINDTYGHPNGDVVLRKVASVCRSALRDDDIIGRMGGEEFVVLLPDIDRERGLLAAERIRKTLASSPIEFAGGSIEVTASLGVIVTPPVQGGNNSTDLLKHAMALADGALYSAKKAGKNRVEVGEFVPFNSACPVKPSRRMLKENLEKP